MSRLLSCAQQRSARVVTMAYIAMLLSVGWATAVLCLGGTLWARSVAMRRFCLLLATPFLGGFLVAAAWTVGAVIGRWDRAPEAAAVLVFGTTLKAILLGVLLTVAVSRARATRV